MNMMVVNNTFDTHYREERLTRELTFTCAAEQQTAASGTALALRMQRTASLRAPAVLAAARPQTGFTACAVPMILLCTVASDNVVVRSSFESALQ